MTATRSTRPTRPAGPGRPAVHGAALAAATATVLAATAFLALPATAAAVAADDGGGARDRTAAQAPAAVELTDGTLDWGVKKSFRDYVTGPIGGGDITVGDGAEENPDGTFRFTAGTGTYDPGSHGVDVAFEGSVRFAAHGGQLDLAFADLKVTSDDGRQGTITADVSTGGTSSDDVEVAALDLAAVEPGQGEGGEMTFADVPATLTAEGAKAFNGFYKEGDDLDPATLAVRPVTSGTGGTGAAGGGGESGNGSAGTGSTGGTGGAGSTGASGGTGADTGPAPGTGSGSDPADPADPATAESGEVVDGNLDWGVKESFRTYVTGPIGGGKVELSGGAQDNGDGYRFPGGNGDLDSGAGSLDADFDGAVRFLAHKESGQGQEYALDLKFSALRVETDGTEGSLVADVAAKDRKTGEVSEYDALTVASLTVPDGALTPDEDIVTLDKLPATLTADGAKAFGGFYEKGDALDPVTVSVALDEGAELPGGGSDGTSGSSDSSGSDGSSGSSSSAGTVGGGDTGGSGSLASTGTGTPVAALLGGAGGLALIGAAAAYATRRRGPSSPSGV
ncbi:hypothetical protein DVA86_25805 [Streptomyces armeniacus]|uniref:Htaa domain-containing protein n=1 Tax=Streptomyces armeniacus TaxID=83291 RepID=A0A345XV85_9ACTN|nr:HtaA domain-containing protein [Streptomyces armeniacus]AXK35551.1 hypothetical protein DVA86_25805 [Streptomyces armeniacus]